MAKNINLLIGRTFNPTQNASDELRALSEMAAEINEHSKNIKIIDISGAARKEDIDVIVQQNNYDVILLEEKIGSTSIGAGSIKAWRDTNARIKIILLIPDGKKGGMKLQSLYKSGYYNALYHSDFKGQNIERLILEDREREEARIYYGIPEAEPVAEVDSVEMEEPSAKDAIGIKGPNEVDSEKAAPLVPESPLIRENEAVATAPQNVVEPNDSKEIHKNLKEETIGEFSVSGISPVSNASEHLEPQEALNGDRNESLADKVSTAAKENLSMPPISNNAAVPWVCTCGEQNFGRFCSNCGKQKAEKTKNYSENYAGNESNAAVDDFSQADYAPKKMNHTIKERKAVNDMMNGTNYSAQERVVNRATPVHKKLPDDYYEEQGGFLDEEERNFLSELPEHNKPYEPKFGGGKKEMPAQFEKINVDPSVASYGGYVIKPISDTVVLIEVPNAHFLRDVHVQEGALINLITSRL